jgi:type I restriction enzyme, S subunit
MSAAVLAGYKLTDIGVIPEEWVVSSVGIEFEIKLGKMLDSEKNSGVLKPYLGNRSVQWNRLDLSDLSMMAMSPADLQSFRLEHGDLLVCEGGEVGRSAIWDSSISECYYQKALHRLRPKNGFDARLMLELLRYWSDHGLLGNYVTQTSIAHLTREKFADVSMPVPPLPEQRAIAAALSDVDALLAKQGQLIAKKQGLKQAAIQQLLTGQTRLPGFSGDWEVRSLGDIALMGSGGTPSSSVESYYNGEFPWVSISDMTKGGKVITQTDRNLSSEGLANSAAQIFPEGTILYAMYASLGECSIAGMSVCTSQAILGIRPKQELNSEYLYYYLAFLKSKVKSMGQQGTQSNLSKGMVQAFEILLPRISEQVHIANILSDMDTEIAALEARQNKTRALKQGMMQELLTGKTRLI